MNYKGIKCPVCSREFQPEDDIVVCPDCGSPHHRDCFKKNGHCAMEELHEKQLAWVNPNDAVDKVEPSKGLTCPNCGARNNAGDLQCTHCGQPLLLEAAEPAGAKEFPQGYGGYGPTGPADIFGNMFGSLHETDLIGGLPSKDFIFFVRQNYYYFLRIFKMMCQRSKGFVFNWAAFFFGFFYFFYRKMYTFAAVLLAIVMLTNIPSLIMTYHMLKQTVADPTLLTSFAFNYTGYENLALVAELFTYLRFGIAVFCGFTANKRYYNQVVRSIFILKALGKDEKEYYSSLSDFGGTSLKAVVLVVLGLAVATFALSYVFAANIAGLL